MNENCICKVGLISVYKDGNTYTVKHAWDGVFAQGAFDPETRTVGGKHVGMDAVMAIKADICGGDGHASLPSGKGGAVRKAASFGESCARGYSNSAAKRNSPLFRYYAEQARLHD